MDRHNDLAERLKHGTTTRVRIFVDHANFERGWKRAGQGKYRIGWKALPNAILKQLKNNEYLQDRELELRGVSVYASIHPEPNEMDLQQENWLRYWLDQLPGYTVKLSERQPRTARNDQGEDFTYFVEKGVDTKIACDMLTHAMRDLYDLGVLISDDADLVPSVECVQDLLDRQVVHAGFREAKCGSIRSSAWSHVLLDKMLGDIRGDARQKGEPVAPA
jgi:uncharacterized LabA/DUF88 family protein